MVNKSFQRYFDNLFWFRNPKNTEDYFLFR